MRAILYIAIVMLVLMMCSKEQVGSRPYPRLITDAVSDIMADGATYHARLTYVPSTTDDHGFIWSLNETPTFENSDTVSLGSADSAQPFSIAVTRSLLNDQKYYVRAYARTNDYLVLGDIVSFLSSGSLHPNSITNISPSRNVLPRSTVTVRGNFGAEFTVKLNGQTVAPAAISAVSKSAFKLQVPGGPELYTLSVVIGGEDIEAKQKISMALSRQVAVRPAGLNDLTPVFVIGSKSYFGLGTDSLFVFDPVSQSFTYLAHLPIPAEPNGFSFAVNGKAYYGWSSNFYSIDGTTGAVTQLANLADGSTVNMFSLNGKGYRMNYVSSAKIHELYEFNPVTGLWTKKASLAAQSFAIRVAEFEANGKAYVLRLVNYDWDGHLYSGGLELSSYNPDTDHWTAGPEVTQRGDLHFGLVATNGTTYLGISFTAPSDYSSTTSFFEFSPTTETFSPWTVSTPLDFPSAATFSIGGVGYVISKSYVWKFHPLP